jgi:hypothetical protein
VACEWSGGEIENDEHAEGDICHLVCRFLAQVGAESVAGGVVLFPLEFDDESKAIEGEQQVDTSTANMLGLDDQVGEAARSTEPLGEVPLELSFGCFGVEEVSGVAAIASALGVEAKREKADDSHDDGLRLFLDLAGEVIALR